MWGDVGRSRLEQREGGGEEGVERIVGREQRDLVERNQEEVTVEAVTEVVTEAVTEAAVTKLEEVLKEVGAPRAGGAPRWQGGRRGWRRAAAVL